MLITQLLISKGILSSHPKYGPIPKLIFVYIMGYFAGKLFNVKTCQEKFKNLETSPLGEALWPRQAWWSSPPGHYSQKSKFDSNVEWSFIFCDILSRRQHGKRDDSTSWPGGLVGWVLSYTPKNCRFDSRSGHIPKLWVRSLAWACTGGNWLIFLSLK